MKLKTLIRLKNSMNPGIFETLPDELLVNICLNLVEMSNFAKVCRKFYNIFCDEAFWKTKCLQTCSQFPDNIVNWSIFYQSLGKIQTYMREFNSSGHDLDEKYPLVKRPIKFDIPIKEIATGNSFTLILDIYFNVWTVGKVDDLFSHPLSFPTQIPNFKAKAIFSGNTHVAAIDLDSQIWVWGSNYETKLVVNQNIDKVEYPILIPGPRAKSLGCGWSQTLVIDVNDNVWGWGANKYGQLGLDNRYNQDLPVQIPGLKAKSVYGYHLMSAVIDLEDNLWIFGGGLYGPNILGNNSRNSNKIQIKHLKVLKVVFTLKFLAILDLQHQLWLMIGGGFSKFTSNPIRDIYTNQEKIYMIYNNLEVWEYSKIGFGYPKRDAKLKKMAFKANFISSGCNHIVVY